MSVDGGCVRFFLSFAVFAIVMCGVLCVCGVQMYRYFQNDCGGLAVQQFKGKLQLKRRVNVVTCTGGSRSKRTV